MLERKTGELLKGENESEGENMAVPESLEVFLFWREKTEILGGLGRVRG